MCKNILTRFGCWLAASDDERSASSAIRYAAACGLVVLSGYISMAIIGWFI